MRKRAPLRTLAAAVLLASALVGCGDDETDTGTTGPAEAILAEQGLDGMDTVELIDHLDRLGGDERPDDLMASVRVDELVVSAGDEEEALPIDDDLFYLSFAPYVDQTHECFYHSLTTCQGELVEEDLQVRLVDETHDEVLLDDVVTTFENGFVGVWLPRDIEATLEVALDGKSGTARVGTGPDDPTCLTTLQLT